MQEEIKNNHSALYRSKRRLEQCFYARTLQCVITSCTFVSFETKFDRMTDNESEHEVELAMNRLCLAVKVSLINKYLLVLRKIFSRKGRSPTILRK